MTIKIHLILMAELHILIKLTIAAELCSEDMGRLTHTHVLLKAWAVNLKAAVLAIPKNQNRSGLAIEVGDTVMMVNTEILIKL